MSITVLYKHDCREKFDNVSDLREKKHGFSFQQGKEYIFITYDSIIAFSLIGDDENDT